MSEHTEQKAVINWFRLQHPALTGCLIAISNGSVLAGNKTQRCKQINKLKAEGFKNGVSDLFLAVPNSEYHGAWIEMKDKGATLCKVKKEQRDHLELMTDMGYAATWCAGFEAAKIFIEDYMKISMRLRN